MKRALVATLILACCLAWSAPALARKHRTYVVKKGDTPGAIAKRFRITSDELFRYNNLKPETPIRLGQKLTIPFPGEVTGTKYKVKSGDSIARIADFHGVSQNDLMEANGLRKGQSIRIGQTLTIPHVLRGDAARSHVVRKGDTLAKSPAFREWVPLDLLEK